MSPASGYAKIKMFSRCKSTQCNMFLLHAFEKKSKQTQTSKFPNTRRSIGMQTCTLKENRISPTSNTGGDSAVPVNIEPNYVFVLNTNVKKETVNAFTQCSLNLLIPKMNRQMQTENVHVVNAFTQCCLDLRIPHSQKNRETQTEDMHVQIVNTRINENYGIHSSSQAIIKLPELLQRVISILQEGDDLKSNLCYEARKNNRGEHCLILKHVDNLALPGEDIDPVQVVITQSGKCSVFKLFNTVEVTNLVIQGTLLEDKLLDVLEPLINDTYVFCPGIKTTEKEFYTKSVVLLTYPMLRTQASQCPVWYKRELTSIPRKFKVVQCVRCTTASRSIAMKKKRKLKATMDGKEPCAESDGRKKSNLNRVKKPKRELKENVPELDNVALPELDSQVS